MTSGVTAVVPNWNRAALLAGTLTSLHAQRPALHEVIVVDGASTDGSAELAAQQGARVIGLTANRGFAAAVNRGVGDATTRWVLVANNDIWLAPDYTALLQQGAESAQAAFATGLLFSMAHPDRIDSSYDLVSRGGCAWRAHYGRAWPAGEPDGREILFGPFTAILIDREIYARLGGLDEEFGSYLEDVDFGLRAAAAGCNGLFVPSAVGRHKGSATLGAWSSPVVRLISRNQLLLVAKHFPSGWGRYAGWQVLVGQLLWGLLAVRHGTGAAWVRGKAEALRRFSKWRSKASPSPRVLRLLSQSEGEIRQLQQQDRADWYWRNYFRWAG